MSQEAATDKYKLLFERAYDAIFLADAETGILLDCNAAAEKLLGRPKMDIIGQHQSSIHPPGRLDSGVRDSFQSHRTGDFFTLRKEQVITADGVIKEVMIDANIIQWDGRNILCGIFHDLSADIERDQEAKIFGTLLDTLPIPVFFKDKDFKYSGCNRAYLELLGQTESEIIGKTVFDLHPAAIAEAFHHMDQEIVATRQHQKFESTFYSADKSTRNILVHRSCVLDKDNNLNGLVGAIIDITELKQAEYARLKSEEKFRHLFNNAEIGMFRTRLDGSEFLDLNDKYLAILGGTREELLGKPAVDIWANLQEREAMTEILQAKGRVNNMECRLIRMDGKIIDCLTSLRLYREQGILEGSILDISERKRVENALKASEIRYRRLFDASRDALMTLAPPSWQFLSGNPAAIKLFGCRDEAEFTSQSPWKFSPERQPDGSISVEKALEMITLAMRDGSHHFEWTHRRSSGEDFPATVLLTRVEIDGEAFLSATVRDETEKMRIEKERVELQAQLFHAEKLASIGTLAAGVAHEINNPLAVVKGFTQMLTKKLTASRSNDDDKMHLTMISDAIGRISTIIDSLRTHARSDTDYLEVLDINKIISEIFPFVGEISRSAGIAISQNFATCSPHIRGNVGKVQQVLLNLLTNACDALQSRASDRCIVVATSADAQQVTISVTDNGMGIPATIQSKIFEPFYTTKPVGKGTGLGLSISRSIVESFGGTFHFSSQEAEGSIFSIKLPLAYPQHTQDCLGDRSSKSLSCSRLRGNVLIIDDEPGLCELFRTYLEEMGLTVTTMIDPHGALRIIAQKSFDIIITDIQMPGFSGVELIKQAQKMDTQAGTKYIVITGGITTNSSLEERTFLQEAIQGYLVKPFEDEELIALVEALLAK